jgi:hypothetical protein
MLPSPLIRVLHAAPRSCAATPKEIYGLAEVNVKSHYCSLLVFSCVLGSSVLMADVTGTILGTCKDQSNAAVAGVTVVVTNQETNFTQTVTSGSDGQYRVQELPIGKYRLVATAAGFQRFAVTDIVLDVNQQSRIDVSLVVGSVQTEVSVTADALAVETTSSQLGEVIEERKIMDLPLNGRSFVDLLGLQAGVAAASAGTISGTPVSGNLAAGNQSVNGQRETTNAFMVNGADVSEGRSMGASVIPNLDSVQEFRLITNSFDAEYGRFSGAVMNAVTKSGTNAIHGSLFEFLRNDKMDARNFFDPAHKGVLKRNQFGYSAGGRIIKNKLFWFSDYQETRQVSGISTGLVPVPTTAQRAGDLSSDSSFVKGGATVNGTYWAQILSQRLGYTVSNGELYTSATCVTTTQCAFPGGIIPTRAISPAAAGTLQFIPLPNSGASGYTTSSANSRINDGKLGEKVDFTTQKYGNWNAYYHHDSSSIFNPLQGSSFPGFAGTSPTAAQLAVLSNTKIIGPTTVNEAHLSFTRMHNITNIPTSGFAKVSSFGFVESSGLGIYPSSDSFEGVPRIALNNYSFGLNGGRIQADNTWMASDTLSKIIGKHALKMGGEFRYLQINERNVTAQNGNFTFNGSETGSDFGDYLLGAPTSYIQASLQQMDNRTHYGGAFIQDSWRVSSNLTINMGLRWEVSQFWYDTQDKLQTLVPGQQSTVFPNAPLGWVFPGDKGIPRTFAPTGYNNFSPRLGFAYSPSATDGILGKLFGGPGKTSIRAGTGRYFTAVEDAAMFNIIADAPFGLYWVSPTPPLFEQPFLTRSNGVSIGQRFPFVLPNAGDPATKNINFDVFLPISSSPVVDTHAKLPYALHYNFTIQRALGKNTVLSMAYVGTQGRKLPVYLESNPGNVALCKSLTGSGVKAGTVQCGPNQEDNVFTLPNGSQIYGTRLLNNVVVNGQAAYAATNAYTKTMGNSSYNSGQITLEHRAGNMTFLAAYTRSKSIDDASTFGNYVNFTNYALSRGLSRFDEADNFVISYGYALPFDKAFSRAPKALVNGWTINGITRFAGGFPIVLSQTGDKSLTGTSGVDVPNFIGPLVTQDPRQKGPTGKANMFFNPAAFTSEALGTFGTANHTFFHGPGFNNFDFAVHKDTKIRERFTLQIRGEFFNVMNHAQFNNPSGSFTSSSFGYVTSARAPRIGQVGAKILW